MLNFYFVYRMHNTSELDTSAHRNHVWVIRNDDTSIATELSKLSMDKGPFEYNLETQMSCYRILDENLKKVTSFLKEKGFNREHPGNDD